MYHMFLVLLATCLPFTMQGMEFDERANTLLKLSYDGNVQEVEKLLQQGVNVDWQNSEGNTALMEAVSGHQLAIVKKLLAAKANKNLRNKKGFTAFALAKYARTFINPEFNEKGAQEMAEMVQMLDDKGQELYDAVAAGNISDVRKYIKLDANASWQNSYHGETALMQAIKDKKVDIFKELLAAKPDVNIQDNSGMTALMFAAFEDNPSRMVQDLYKHGAKPDIQDKQGYTALAWAVIRGKAVAVHDLLFSAEADPNIPDRDGRTPLMIAAQENQLLIAKKLLNANADQTRKNNDGKTALMLATSRDMKELLQESEEAGTPASTEEKKHTAARVLTAADMQALQEQIGLLHTNLTALSAVVKR